MPPNATENRRVYVTLNIHRDVRGYAVVNRTRRTSASYFGKSYEELKDSITTMLNVLRREGCPLYVKVLISDVIPDSKTFHAGNMETHEIA